jgi:transcriptional regulator with XRE-family HTH domain
MKTTPTLSDAAILQLLGERIGQHRLQANLTQAELAAQAGVGLRTLQRIEAGGGIETTSFVRVLRGLGLIEGLDQLVPELPPSPIAQLELHGKRRQRATGRRRKKAQAPSKPWAWEEE